MHEIINFIAPLMPEDKPRYLMGIGDLNDMLAAVETGFDMFDCVMPTRNARNGTLLQAVEGSASRGQNTKPIILRWMKTADVMRAGISLRHI